MRPYLAILKDSFREALASRLLWVLLILITLLLVGLAPISIQPAAADPEFQPDHIRNPALLAETLAEGRKAEAPSPARRIWRLLPESFRNELDQDDSAMAPFEMQWRLADQLNRLLNRRDLYEEDAWRNVDLPEDAEPLLARGPADLSDEQVARLNRLLIEAAFPAAVETAPATAVRLSYPVIGDTRLPYDMQQVRAFVKWVISQLIQWLVGVFGVLIAILVTAPIVPKTFEPGAINLLLSKPVARPLLFLTKFVGGCAFVVLNVTYLMVGLWLIAGWRFEIWSGNLLLCIPVFLFLFMIYYSVSALVGVIWNSWILCVVFTALFWLACAAVGWTKGIVETFFLQPEELVAVAAPAGDAPVAVNRRGEILQWQDRKGRWEQILQGVNVMGQAPFATGRETQRMSYDRHGDRLLIVDSAGVAFGMAPSAELVVAEHHEGWRQLPRITLPAGASQAFATPEGDILALGPAGVFRLDDLPEAGQLGETAENAAEFLEAGPTVSWGEPFTAALHPETGDLAVYERGTLHHLRRTDKGDYVAAQQARTEADGPVQMAYAGTTLVIATAQGTVRLWNAETWQAGDTLTPFDDRLPRQTLASPDGRWLAVLSQGGEVWLYEAGNRPPGEPAVEGENASPSPRIALRGISAIAFSADGHLWTAREGRRVTAYRLAPFERQDRFAPPQTRMEIAYHYAIHPLYTVFPKPGKLNDVVAYLLTDEDEPPMNRRRGPNPAAAQATPEIWSPLSSNLAFMAVVLAATSLYVYRKDF